MGNLNDTTFVEAVLHKIAECEARHQVNIAPMNDRSALLGLTLGFVEFYYTTLTEKLEPAPGATVPCAPGGSSHSAMREALAGYSTPKDRAEAAKARAISTLERLLATPCGGGADGGGTDLVRKLRKDLATAHRKLAVAQLKLSSDLPYNHPGLLLADQQRRDAEEEIRLIKGRLTIYS